MEKLTIKDIDLKDKRILMRVDFNVPLDENLEVSDDTRLKATLPTIKYALERGARKVILISHLGRPDGKVMENLRLNPVAKRLGKLLTEPVKKLDDCVGEEIKKQIESANERVVLLENLRFHPEEEKNDPIFAKELAKLAEIFVNDAFGTAHRAHASTEGVTKYLTSVAGLLLEKEISYLGSVLTRPKAPFLVILGGAKVSDKIGIIENLLPKLDEILIGGGMAYTFLKAEGKEIGNSKLEKDKLGLAKEILNKAKRQKVKVFLPIDNIVADKIDANANIKVVGENIPEGYIGLDIGPKTIRQFKATLKKSKTIVWNGPLGVFEIAKFSKGTEEIAKFITTLKATTIIGGGDTAAAVAKLGLEEKMTHISTGGGASLEFLEGKTLPGIAALSDNK